ncbi:hypothetical protein SAMN05444377_11177 [Flavobacterium fontis]|uniref:Uncharacterized protein n=1 Tax=Flavobacterium fontis TaxID=1124188 RepID=A0A1M5CD99_9FLAO|nr:hypothetical protein SAMN05444377_11177 [Flavobacterium fontis]
MIERVKETSCGLIKDWKQRYSVEILKWENPRCGLIKDWKQRYFEKKY